MDENKLNNEPEQTEAPESMEEKKEYTPRPLGIRIFAWVLAILVIAGVILYYYNIFTAGR